MGSLPSLTGHPGQAPSAHGWGGLTGLTGPTGATPAALKDELKARIPPPPRGLSHVIHQRQRADADENLSHKSAPVSKPLSPSVVTAGPGCPARQLCAASWVSPRGPAGPGAQPWRSLPLPTHGHTAPPTSRLPPRTTHTEARTPSQRPSPHPAAAGPHLPPRLSALQISITLALK